MKNYWFVLSLSVVCLPQSAAAIVNVSQSVVDSHEEGWSNTAHLGLDGAQGNTDKISVKADLLSQWQHGDNTDFLLLEHAYGKSSGAVNTDRTFAHLRHRQQQDDVLAFEIFAQTGRDAFARLANRTLLGVGMRLTLHEEPKVSGLYLGLGVFSESERLSQIVGTTDRPTHTMRGNIYVVYRHQVNPQVILSSTTYVQPSLQQASDIRLLEQAALHVGLLENLKLKMSMDYSYDEQPPQTVSRDDLRYHTGLELRF